MNIYLLKQSDNYGYDAYDGMVVIAPDEKTARELHPWQNGWMKHRKKWANSPETVKVKLLGKAHPSQVNNISIPNIVLKSSNRA